MRVFNTCMALAAATMLPIAAALRVAPGLRLAPALRLASAVRGLPQGGARMRVEFNDVDFGPDWSQQELEATWGRAGKGRSLWKPGDKTDNPISDARLLYTNWKLNPMQLHIYDHCPFCMRARFVLGWLQVPHTSMVYGYGAGADPAKCDGRGYGEGPLGLVGKKALPVLTGAGVPSPQWVHDSPAVRDALLPHPLASS